MRMARTLVATSSSIRVKPVCMAEDCVSGDGNMGFP
ncbi:MAG: hypothetical protein LBH01_11670 [Verrucomicrobiales bacterium]|nr:hypothetical protein [Verrucomicrobiales bacterium]